MATTITPLDQATRDSVVSQAKSRATASGKTPEQEFYSFIQSQGINGADADTYMGWDAGTTQKWAAANVPAAQGNNSAASINSGGILGGSTQTPATPSTPASTPASVQYVGDAERDNIVTQARARGTASGKSPEQEFYNYIQSNGISAADADKYMGWDAGTTQKWASANIPAAQGNNSAASINGTSAPTTTPAASSARYVGDSERDNIVAQARARAQASGKSPEQEFYSFIQSQGISAADADVYMGWEPGTTQRWAAANGGGGGGGAPGGRTTGILSTLPGTTAAVNPTNLGLPATWQVSPDQTVEGRINNLTDPNNPLIAQARSRALQNMNGRGLLNSSIAMGAADSAAYDAAMPIATADAANASKVAGYNTDQQNQFAIKNLDNATNRYSIDTNAATSRYNSDKSADTQLKIKQLDQSQQTQLAQLETQNKALLQNSSVASSAYDKYANTLYNNSVNKDMTPEARYQADQNAFNIYQQQLSLASKLMGVPDVSGLLDFTQVDPAAPAPAKDTTVIGGGNVTPPASPVVVGGGILTGNGFEMR